MAADPNVAPILKAEVEAMVREFLDTAVKFSVLWQTLDDPWQAKAILADALLWMKEATDRIDRELRMQKQTAPPGRRGGVS